jgi:hypothetical protein
LTLTDDKGGYIKNTANKVNQLLEYVPGDSHIDGQMVN